MTPKQFKKVTALDEFPAFLNKDVKDGVLHVMSNGEFTYRLKGVHAKVSVSWNFEAPPGAADTPDYSSTIPVPLVRGRYVKLQAKTLWRPDAHTGLAEVQVFGF